MAKRILIVLLLVLIAIQFIRPKLNATNSAPGKNDLVALYPTPPDIKGLLVEACYDCHSNNTRYPWYNHIQPVAWWLAGHVDDGKRALNFNEFGGYSLKKQAHKLSAISDQVSNREMPLASYTWIHRGARLTDAQIEKLTAWSDGLHDQIAPDDAAGK